MNRKPNQELIKLSDLCWQYRDIAKYLGVPAHSLKDWRKSFECKKIKLQTESEKNYFTEVKVEADLSTIKAVDKSELSLVFEKNGIRYEIKNLSSHELIQIIGMS